MTSELVKLLVDIEENAKEAIASNTTRVKSISTASYKFRSSPKPQNFYKKTIQELKDKRRRRTLRSKIAKILSNLPCRCEKQSQQKLSLKWAEQKRKLYELNLILKEKGLATINKLNISSDGENSEEIYASPRNELMKNLSEEELAIISDDPAYFMQDKKLLQLNSQNDWDKLILNDPKDPENIKKGIKMSVAIDFLKHEEKAKKSIKINQKPKNFFVNFKNSEKIKVEIKTGTSIFESPSKKTEVIIPRTIAKKPQTSSQTSPELKKVIGHFPSLKIKVQNQIVSQNNRNPQNNLERKSSNKELLNFLSESAKIQDMRKNCIIKSATDTKLYGVKGLLSAWESKRRVSIENY